MDKTEYYIKIDKNINRINAIENDLSTLQYAMYQKAVEGIKSVKLLELRDYLENQCVYYGQKTYSFKDEINQIYEEYEFQMKRITNVYDKMFVDVLKILKNAYNNQKIAVSNILTIDNQYNNTDFLTPEKVEELKRIKQACAQKKVNYSVIVRECKARINWIIKNVQTDLRGIFENKDIIGVVGIGAKRHVIKQNNEYDIDVNKEEKEEKKEDIKIDENQDEKSLEKKKESQLASAVKESVVAKFLRIVNNLISGNNNFKKVINDYQANYLYNIKVKVDERTKEVAYIIAGVTKQLEQAKNKINQIYENSTKSN